MDYSFGYKQNGSVIKNIIELIIYLENLLLAKSSYPNYFKLERILLAAIKIIKHI
jgi:hypothetical protein